MGASSRCLFQYNNPRHQAQTTCLDSVVSTLSIVQGPEHGTPKHQSRQGSAEMILKPGENEGPLQFFLDASCVETGGQENGQIRWSLQERQDWILFGDPAWKNSLNQNAQQEHQHNESQEDL